MRKDLPADRLCLGPLRRGAETGLSMTRSSWSRLRVSTFESPWEGILTRLPIRLEGGQSRQRNIIKPRPMNFGAQHPADAWLAALVMEMDCEASSASIRFGLLHRGPES